MQNLGYPVHSKLYLQVLSKFKTIEFIVSQCGSMWNIVSQFGSMCHNVEQCVTMWRCIDSVFFLRKTLTVTFGSVDTTKEYQIVISLGKFGSMSVCGYLGMFFRL